MIINAVAMEDIKTGDVVTIIIEDNTTYVRRATQQDIKPRLITSHPRTQDTEQSRTQDNTTQYNTEPNRPPTPQSETNTP